MFSNLQISSYRHVHPLSTETTSKVAALTSVLGRPYVNTVHIDWHIVESHLKACLWKKLEQIWNKFGTINLGSTFVNSVWGEKFTLICSVNFSAIQSATQKLLRIIRKHTNSKKKFINQLTVILWHSLICSSLNSNSLGSSVRTLLPSLADWAIPSLASETSCPALSPFRFISSLLLFTLPSAVSFAVPFVTGAPLALGSDWSVIVKRPALAVLLVIRSLIIWTYSLTAGLCTREGETVKRGVQLAKCCRKFS